MQVNVVPHGSPAYAQTVKLRQDMLRTPLGLTLTPAQLATETDQVHLAAFDGEPFEEVRVPHIGMAKQLG